MHIASRQTWVLIVCVTALVTACADPPTREMDQAQGAIDTARAAGAAEFAGEELGAAEAALARSFQAVEERDYRQALSHALDARERAQISARQAADEKARVRTEADRALRAAETDLARTRARLEAADIAPRALEAATAAMSSAEADMASAQEAFDQGNYRLTFAASTDLQAHLETAISEIDAALSAGQNGRPARPNP